MTLSCCHLLILVLFFFASPTSSYALANAALSQGLPPERTVAVDTVFGLEGRRTLMTTPVTDPHFRDQAHALFAAREAKRFEATLTRGHGVITLLRR